MLQAIDGFVVARIERFAHFLQRHFGIHPVSVAMVGDMVFAIAMVGGWFLPGSDPSPTHKIVDSLFFLLIFWMTIRVYPQWEKDADRDVSRGLANKYKVNIFDICLRIFVLGAYCFDLLHLYQQPNLLRLDKSLTGTGLVVALYFLACDPLPPGRSTVRKFLDGLAKKRAVQSS